MLFSMENKVMTSLWGREGHPGPAFAWASHESALNFVFKLVQTGSRISLVNILHWQAGAVIEHSLP